MTNITSGSEVERAWEIHKDADGIFHHRLNAYLVGEAFLVSALVSAFLVSLDGKSSMFAALLTALICLFGLLLSVVMQVILNKAYDRLLSMKRLIVSDPVYAKYLGLPPGLSAEDRVERMTRRPHILMDGLLWLITGFWLLASLLVMLFFARSTP